MDAPNNPAIKGRGAVSNPANRYQPTHHEKTDDGWWREDEPESIVTVLTPEQARTIITKNSSPDIPFDRSINVYRGCEHGCIYCYARPTHAYLDLSPGLDFETKITYKPNAADRLRHELAKPGYRVQPIAMGTNTDPYQPVERQLKLTRAVLEVLLAQRHPATITTKGGEILRDLDLLADMAKQNLISVAVSITTLSNDLKRILEPRTASPAKRLDIVRKLHAAQVPVSVMAAPVIPFINDHELEHIVEQSAEAGARSANYILLRLPLEVSPLFREWLDTHFPDRAKRVMSVITDTRGGKDYTAQWGTRMRGEGVYADLLSKRFDVARRKAGLSERGQHALNCDAFVPPVIGPQLTLF